MPVAIYRLPTCLEPLAGRLPFAVCFPHLSLSLLSLRSHPHALLSLLENKNAAQATDATTARRSVPASHHGRSSRQNSRDSTTRNSLRRDLIPSLFSSLALSHTHSLSLSLSLSLSESLPTTTNSPSSALQSLNVTRSRDCRLLASSPPPFLLFCGPFTPVPSTCDPSKNCDIEKRYGNRSSAEHAGTEDSIRCCMQPIEPSLRVDPALRTTFSRCSSCPSCPFQRLA